MVTSLNGTGNLPNCTKQAARTIWKYFQADLDKANELLIVIDWEQVPDTPDVNQALQNWEGTVCLTWTTLPNVHSIKM